LGWIPTTKGWQEFAEWFTAYLPARTQRAVLQVMLELSRGYGKFLSFGLVFSLWSASTGFLSLMEALNRAYGTRDKRSYLKRRLSAIAATLLGAGFLLGWFGLWNAGHFFMLLIRSDFGNPVLFHHQWRTAHALLSLAMLWLGVDLINFALPGRIRS